jgi:hypothetical protein
MFSFYKEMQKSNILFRYRRVHRRMYAAVLQTGYGYLQKMGKTIGFSGIIISLMQKAIKIRAVYPALC